MQKINFFFILFFSIHGWANCVFMGDTKPKIYQIIDTYKTKHVDGSKVFGCLLKYKNEKNETGYAYSHYNFICQLKDSEKISLKNSEACCDAGDHGDYTCGLKPVNPLSQVPRVSTTLSPENLDKRAWPDILDGLQDSSFRVYSASAKAIEFLKDEKLKSLVIDSKAKIKTIFLNSKDYNQKSALGILLLEIDPNDSNEFSIRLAQLKASAGANFYSKIEVAQKISKFTSKAQEIIPALIEALRLSFKPDEKVAYLKVLENFPAETAKKLTQILRAFKSEQNDPALQAAWTSLVCKSLAPPQSAASSLTWQSVQFSSFSDIPAVVCQSR